MPVRPAPRYRTVVVAGLRPSRPLDSPRSVDVLEQGRILQLAPRSTPELFETLPGVAVQKTNHGGGSPFVRGFTGQHVLQMLDGIRLNNSTTRYGPNQTLNTVDPYSLCRVELLRGPGSTLYGSDAIGGVIGLFSREAPLSKSARFLWGGAVTGRLSSADRSQIYNLYSFTQVHRVSLWGGGSFKWFNSLEGGRGIGTQPFTGYKESAWDGGVKVRLARRWVLKLATSSTRQWDVPRTDQSTATDFRFFSRQDRDLAYLKVSGSRGRYLKQFQAIASYQSHRELRHRWRLARDRIEEERDDLHTVGLAVSAATDFGRWSRLVYGVDLYYDILGSVASREGISSGRVTPMDTPGVDWRGRFVDGSAYLQGGIFFSDEFQPLSWLKIAGGIRLAFSRADIPADPLATVFGFDSQPITTSFVGPAGELSLTFIPAKPLRLIASVQQGFRAPNLDDYSHVGAEGLAWDLPSPDLDKAETTTTLEAGAKLRWKRLSAWIFGHYSFLRDFIMRRYTGEIIDGEPAAVRVNAARGYLAGVEGMAQLRLPRGFSLSTWVSWTRGDLTDPFSVPGTQPMRRVSPLQGLATVRWRHDRGSYRYFVELSLRWSARQDRLSPGDRQDSRICPEGPDRCAGTPGFAVLNLAGGARLTRHVDIVLRIENLGNEPYKYHGSGVYAPGLSAVTELRLRL